MKQFLLSVAVFLFAFNSAQSQLSSGSPAPAFTVTDLDGNTHDLYSYLNSGVSVIIDVSATWCGPCWSYHNSGTLENIYNSYGPGGTGECMVIFMEGDANTNLACLYGPSGCVGGTQGNWVAGTPYPIVHEEGPSVRASYQVNAYPTIFMISAANKKSYTNGGGGPSQTYIERYLLQSFRMTATPNVTDATCGGDGAIELDVQYGYGTLTYAWSNGATSKNLANVLPGVYTCTITDANGHDIVTDPITVGGIVTPLEAIPTSTTDPSCFGGTNGSATFSAFGGNPDYTYLWDDGQTGPTKNNCGAGEHHLLVTDALGCTFENFVVLSEPDQVEVAVSAPPVPCGVTKGTITLAASGGTPPFTYNLGAGPQSSGIFTDKEPGTYNYTVLDNKNCTVSDQVTLTAIQGPLATAQALDSLTCTKSEVEVSGVGSSTGSDVTYNWKTSDGVIVSGQDSIVATVSAGGIYILEVTNTGSGCVSTDTVQVKQSTDVPQLSIAVPGEITCLVSSVQLTGQLNGDPADFTILWSTTDGNIISGGNTLNPVVNEAGTYQVNVVSNLNGCEVNKSTLVVENINIPTADYTYTFDQGTFTGHPQTQSDNNTFSWDFGNGSTSSEKEPTVTLGEGTFNVCLTVSNECDTVSHCTLVSNLAILSVSTTTVNIACNGQTNGSISLGVTGGAQPYTYNWTGPNGFASSESSLTNLSAGIYYVTVTDANNSSVTATSEITEPKAIVTNSVNIINDNNGKGEGSITLDISGGTGSLSYLWSNGATTSSISKLNAGSYTCTVTDANGCQKVVGPLVVENTTSTDEARYVSLLNIFPNPASNAINIDVEFINSENVTLELNNSLGHVNFIRNYAGNINTTLDISELPSGVYYMALTGKEFKITKRVIVIR